MSVVFAPRPIAHPDQALLGLCTRWHALYHRWEGKLRVCRYSFTSANEHYEAELRPLLEQIAGMPAQTDQGFEAKLCILLECDLCGVIAGICKLKRTECSSFMAADRAEPRGRPRWNELH